MARTLRIENGSQPLRRSRWQQSRSIELLEARYLLASDWHNETLPGDIDRSGMVTPRDALVVINELSARRASDRITGWLPSRSEESGTPTAYFDVTGDQYLTGRDASEILAFLASGTDMYSWRVDTNLGVSADFATHVSAAIPDEIIHAFKDVSELSNYTAGELNGVSEWVVLLKQGRGQSELLRQLSDPPNRDRQGAPAPFLTQLGTPLFQSSTLIEDTYIVSWDRSANTFAPPISEFVDRLRSSDSIASFYPLVERQEQTRFVPNDTYYASQWHLKNTGQTQGAPGIDVNIESAWDQYLGSGVVIGIVDDGLQRTHPDLLENTWTNPLETAANGLDDDGNGLIDDLVGWDFVDNDADPTPFTGFGHGTSVAGVSAGRGNNGIGISGSAPRSQLVGLELVSGAVNDFRTSQALSYQSQQIDIYNNSWGPADDGVLDPRGPLGLAALRSGTTYGRDGLGNIYVWSAGNGGFRGNDNANYDPYANSRYTIAVGAIDHLGKKSIYSEPGANVLVTAPSNPAGDYGITTTDLVGADGFHNATSDACISSETTNDYTVCFGGTSSSAPLVSGVIALMLEANPDLTWRDVKHILVETSKPTDKDQTVQPANDDLPVSTGWQKNSAGKLVNHNYGFGVVDAHAAVTLAANWNHVGGERSSRPIMTVLPVGPNVIVDNGSAVSSAAASLSFDEPLTIETVQVVLNATHGYNPDLEVVLTHTTPDGQISRSILAEQHVPCNGNAGAFTACATADEIPVGTLNTQNYDGWTFSSIQHWGESTAGTWSLSVQDRSSYKDSTNGSFDSWSIQFHGTASRVTPQSLGTRINELNLNVTGTTVVVPGFEPFDDNGDSFLSLANAIRDRGASVSGNDTSWLLDYDSTISSFDPNDSRFPVYADADWGGDAVVSCYTGSYCAAGSDASRISNGDDNDVDSFLQRALGSLALYSPSTISLSFAFDPQDLENVAEVLEVDVFHDGAWQEAVWQGSFTDDGDSETNAADWQLANIPLGTLGIIDWTNIQFRIEASAELDIPLYDSGGTPNTDEILLDDVLVQGELISNPGIDEVIFFEGFEDASLGLMPTSDPDWRIVQGSDLNRSGEMVVLFDWAKDSRRLSSGWAESAGSTLFSQLVELGLVDLGQQFTVNAATDIFTAVGHGLQLSDEIRIVGDNLPAGIVSGTTYFVTNSTTNTFQLSLTDLGPSINVTANGAAIVRHATADLHIIGQGSGAIVASEAVERLAKFEIDVDHLTYLDPHDFDQGLVTDSSYSKDFANQPAGYGAVVWENVEFADVYYQTRGDNSSLDQVTDTLVPQGRPIPGAVNYWIGPGGANYLPDPSHPNHPDDYFAGNVLGDHRYLWEGFYFSTITGMSPQDNYAAGLTKDTPQPADAIPVDDIGYAYSRVSNSEPRPTSNAFYAPHDVGNWLNGTLYNQSDLVTFAGSDYVARRTHTANSGFGNAPGNPNFWTLVTSPARPQDHRHTPDSLRRGNTATPNFSGLFQLGLSTSDVVDARWHPQWNPLELSNGDLSHVGDDIPKRGDRTIPGWIGQTTVSNGGTSLDLDLQKQVLTLSRDNPSATHPSILIDEHAEAISLQLRVAGNAANDQIRVWLGTTQLVPTVSIPIVTLAPTKYTFDVPASLRGTVQSLRLEIFGGLDGINGKVEIGKIAIEGYAVDVKAGDVSQIDLGGAITAGGGPYVLSDPLATPERTLVLDANFSINGKFHIIPTISNSNGRNAEFESTHLINFTEGGTAKTLRVGVEQGYSVHGTNSIQIPLGSSVGLSGTNDSLQVRQVQQRLRYLNFRGESDTIVPVNGNGTDPIFLQALKLFQASTRDLGPGNPANPLDASALTTSADTTHKWLNSPVAPGWTTLRDGLRHTSLFDTRQWTTTWTHQALENALAIRPELMRVTNEEHGFFSLSVYPDLAPLQHGADRSGLAFGMQLEEASLSPTGPTINTSAPFDLNQPAISTAERTVIRDILATRDAAGTEIRNVLIGGTGAQPDHARLRTILTALNIPNGNVAGHHDHIHVILAAPQAQTALNPHVQTALLNTLATMRDDVVNAARMQTGLQNNLFTTHPDDSIESLLPMALAINKGLYETAVAYLSSTTNPTVEGIQQALNGLQTQIPIPNSEDVLSISLDAQILALGGQLKSNFKLRAIRVAATDQDTVEPRLNPAINILDASDALDHIAVTLRQDFGVTIPLQNTAIPDSAIQVRRDVFEVGAKSFNIRNYAAQHGIVQLDVIHDPVILDGIMSIVFDDEGPLGEISLADLKDPFLATKLTTATVNSEFSGYLAVQPNLCDWLPTGAAPLVTMTDADIFDGVQPVVTTNSDFDLLDSFTTLTGIDLFNAIDQLQAGIDRLADALEPIDGIPFVDSALNTLVEIKALAGDLADSLLDGQTLLFNTIQDLVETLRTSLGLSSEEIGFTCDSAGNTLLLNLDLQREVLAPVEFDFAKTIAPLSISAGIAAELYATLSVDLSLGFDLTSSALTEAAYRNTPIANLNGGNGIATVAGNDLKVSLRDGTMYTVDIDAANPISIEDAYDALIAPSAGKLTYSIVLHPDRDEVVGVEFHDISNTGTAIFSIAMQNASPAGSDLGVVGLDSDGDHAIQGYLRTRSIQDRVFLAEGGGLQILGELGADAINVSVGVGGVGGAIENGEMDISVSAGLTLLDPGTGPNDDGRITLRELFSSPIANTVDIATPLISGEGRLPVVLKPAAFNALAGIDPNHPTTAAEDGPEILVSITSSPLDIDITLNEDFQFIIDSLTNMSFDSVCDGISQVIAFLQDGEFALFNDKLPLINKSINELIESDSLLLDVIDTLCIDFDQLKLDIEALLPSFEQATSPVGAMPAVFADLTLEEQASLTRLRDAIHSALGQEDLTLLPTQLIGTVNSLRDYIAALPNSVNTAQLTAFVNQLDALLPTLDKIEARIESALGLAPNDFTMEFVDLDSNPTTFTRGLIMRMTLGAGYNATLPLDFSLDTVDGVIPIEADSGGMLQVGLNGTLQLDFGIDLSEGVDIEDRLFLVGYDSGLNEGTRLDLSAQIHTNPQITGSVSLGGIDLVNLGPAQVDFRDLQTISLTGVTSQTAYPLSPVIPAVPPNLLDVAFVRVNGQVRNFNTYTLTSSLLTFTQGIPTNGDVIEVLFPGTNPASFVVSLNNVSSADDPTGDPERIIRFSRLFDSTDSFNWENDFINIDELQGMFGANLPLTVPLVTPFTVRAFWDLADPTSVFVEFPSNLGTQLGTSNSCNLPAIVDGIEGFLDALEEGMKSDILEKLPLLGDLDLDQAGVFVHDVRQITSPLLLALGSSAGLQTFLFENLGPGTLSGTGLKLDILVHDHDNNANTPAVPITSIADIGIGAASGKEIWVDIPTSGTECVQFNVRMGGNFGVEADFDLGLSAINFDVSTTGGVELNAGFDVQVGFGLSKATGAYVMLNSDPSDPEIEFDFNVGLAPNTSLDFRLFFLEMSAEEGASAATTGFDLDVMVDIVGPTNPAKITFQQIATTPLKDLASFDIDGDVTVDLTLEAGTTNPDLPSIKADLYVDWGFEFGENQPFMGRDVTVELNNLRIDLGDYLTRIIQPIVQKIDQSLKPLDPLIKFLDTDVPLISDVAQLLGQDAIKVINMVEFFGEGAESAVDFIQQVIDIRGIVSDLANSPPGASFEIAFGNFLMGNGGGLIDPRNSNTEIDPATSPPASFTGSPQDLDQVAMDGTMSNDMDVQFFAEILSTLRTFGVEFPLLENPSSAFGLLFGQPVDFVTYDFLGPDPEDRLQATFSWSQSFGPILPPVPLYANIGASFTIFADFKVGFDSSGLQKGGPFTDGLYFDDTRPVLGLEAQFTAGAELNAGLVWGGVRGGVEAEIGAGWNDINGDGKFRLKELVSRFQQGPQCVFDLGGEMNVFLEAYGGVGIKVLKKVITIFETSVEFLNANIFRFNVACPALPPPVLAHVASNTLVLNIGPHAHLRQAGAKDEDDQVEIIYDTDPMSEHYQKYVVSGFGQVQAYTGINQILVEGGGGNDQIKIGATVSVPVTMRGGDGNDSLTALNSGTFANPTLLYGGPGNDRLVGGPGIDHIFGDDGNDIIFAGAGDDQIEGGAGSDNIKGEDGLDRIEGGADSDDLDGGAGPDLLFGGAGNDHIAGGTGQNQIDGDDGDDSIEGGDDPSSFDTIRAGAGDDVIVAKAGNDVIYAGLGNDLVVAGDGDDLIRGEEGDDQLDGGSGADQYIFVAVTGAAEQDTLNEPATGGGVDHLDFSTLASGDNLTLNLTHGVGQHTKRTLRILNTSQFENVTSGAGNDTLIDNVANNLFIGGQGDDRYVFGAFPLSSATHIDTIDEQASQGTDWIDFRDLSMSEAVIVDLSGSGFYVDPTIAVHTSRTLRTLFAGQHNFFENLRGGSGDDQLTGNSSDNEILGGPGADIIAGLIGLDRIEGNAGTDLISGGPDRDTIDGGSEVDTISGNEGNDLIHGGDHDDIIFGNLGADEIYGDGGLDLIHGNEGPDQIFGGNDDDVIFGDDGDDYVEGNLGRDLVWGGFGNDEIYGNGGEDRLFGQADDDYISGGSGRDFIVGDVGNDELLGGGGDDLVSGGVDTSNGFLEFVGVNGTVRTATGLMNYTPKWFGDRIDGGSGHDLVLGSNVTTSGTFGGPLSSQEQVAYDVFVDLLRELVDAYQASLMVPVSDEVAFVDYLRTITTAISGTHIDGDDILYGGSENDLVIGHDGADHLFGDYGKDTLIPYKIGNVAVATADWVEGGPDDDRLLCGTHADNVMIGGTSDLNLQRTLTYAGQPRPSPISGGYLIPSCVMDDTPVLEPVLPVELHGQKFLDSNGNQVRDFDEPGLNGWVIELRDPEGDIIATTTTMDSDLNQDGIIDPLTETGLFWFKDESLGGNVPRLDPGTFQITEAQQAGYSQTVPFNENPFTLPSGQTVVGVEVEIAPTEFVRGYALTLDSNEIAEGIPLGNAPLGEIRGFKFNDLDGDGLRDPNEPFLAGWQITIQDANNNTQTIATDAAGRYAFSNLTPGSYTITESIPPGWVQSFPGLNAGLSHVVTVGFGELVNNLDFGNVLLASVQGSKWEDLDGDGIRDMGEPAPSQILQIRLTDANGNDQFALTDLNGDFSFSGVYPGVYTLTEIIPPNWVQTYPIGDLFGAHQFVVQSGDMLTDYEFGNYQFSSITGLKWNDLDGDGVFSSPAESGIPGWPIFLDLNENGIADAGEPATTTDSFGVYRFDGLAPGEYTVAEGSTAGWIQSFPGSVNDEVHRVNLFSGTNLVGRDFGNVIKSSITGIKWLDKDADGVQDPDEPGLPNWRIYLDLNQNGQFDEANPEIPGSVTEPFVYTQFDDPNTFVDESGYYELTDLLPGTYTVAEQSQSGWQQSFPGQFGIPGTTQIYVVQLRSQSASGLNFGNFRTAMINGQKWHDVNGDGRRQLITSGDFRGDIGLSQWTIYLDLNGNGQLDHDPMSGQPIEPTAITMSDNPMTPADETGSFTFLGLAPGEYIVSEEMQSGWTQSLPQQSGSRTYRLNVAEGETATIEFANSRAAAISGLKWWDQNLNGVRDASEPGIANWVIYLDLDRDGQLDFGPNGRPSEPATITNAQGEYSFAGLLPGDYLVSEGQQTHWSGSFPNALNLNRHFLVVEGDEVAVNIRFGNSVFGDCDSDLDVDTTDQIAFNAAFDSISTDLNYVTCFDFDQDTDIDFADLYTFRASFGAQATMPSIPGWWKRKIVDTFDPVVNTNPNARPGTGVEYTPTPHTLFDDPQLRPGQQFFATGFTPNSPNPHNLFNIDPAVAGLTLVGPTEPLIIGLSEALNGDIYGLTEGGTLGIVDLMSGNFNVVTQYPIGFLEGDIAFRPGDTNSIWITTGRTPTVPGYLIHADLSGGILSQIEVPIFLSEFGFSGMQFKDANTLYLYEPETRKLVITDTNLTNPQIINFAGGPLGTRAGIDFDAAGQLWIVNKPAGAAQNFLYYVDETVSPWQLIVQGPGTTASQWSSLVIVEEAPVDIGSIRGFKWHDLNADGVRDFNEPGLAGWQIVVSGTTNQGQPFSASVITNGNDPLTPEDETGTYELSQIPLGTYIVSEVLQSGWFQTYPASFFHQITLDDLNPFAEADFGNFRLGMIHGTKYEDNGPLQGLALPGWEIVLTGVDVFGHSIHLTTVTMEDDPLTHENEAGQYWFNDIFPGTYHLEEVQQPGWFAAFPASGFYDFEYLTGETLQLDFFNYRGGTISGLVYKDSIDCEGPYTSADMPLSGVTVYIDSDDDGMLDRDMAGNPTEPFTTTNVNGTYQFTGLPYGTYRIRQELPSMFATSYPASQSYQVTIGFSGQVAAEIDFGDFMYVPLDDGGDLIFASLGADAVYGDNIVQNRCILSYGDNDRIHGEEGNDLLIGQRRNDTYYFLPNINPTESDVLIELEDRGTDDRDDEGGRDRLEYSSLGSLEPVEVDLSGNRLGWTATQIAYYQSNIGQHVVSTDLPGQHNYFEDIIGGSGDDLLTGNAKANWIDGGTGTDLLFGLDGNDTYAFGPPLVGDSDTVTEANGVGGGMDTLDFSANTVPVNVDIGVASLASYGGATVTSATSQWLENVIGGQNSDIIAGNLANNRLEGGPGDDTFLFNGLWGNDVVVEGDNQGNDDVMDFSGATSMLSSVIGTNSVVVTDTFGNLATHNANNIERLEAGANLQHVYGGISANTWNITGPNLGNVNDVEFQNALNLTGGPLVDTFLFVGGSISGDIEGLGDDDIFDLSQTSTGLGVTGQIRGDAGNDLLIGPNQVTQWEITGTNAGFVTGEPITFLDVESLRGEQNNDTFMFQLAGQLVMLEGGLGTDTIVGPNAVSSWQVDSPGTGSTGFVGAFSEMEILDAGTSFDVLQGPQATVTWTLSSNSGGTIGGYLDFSGFERLDGGNLADTFDVLTNVVANVTLFGNGGNDRLSLKANGGILNQFDGGADSDSLDYAQFGASTNVNLQTLLATGVGAFVNIESFVGSAANDVLVGEDNANSWIVNGSQGTVDGAQFEDFEVLEGGTVADQYNVQSTNLGITLRGNLGDDLYVIAFGSLLGAIVVDDNSASANDRIELMGTGLADSFLVNATSTSVGAEQVLYDGSIEELQVLGLAGDDTFDVTPSLTTQMYLDGGIQDSALPGDMLTVHALNQTFVNNGTQVLVNGYQAVNYLGMEQTSVALMRSTVKKVDPWADEVDAFFANLG